MVTIDEEDEEMAAIANYKHDNEDQFNDLVVGCGLGGCGSFGWTKELWMNMTIFKMGCSHR